MSSYDLVIRNAQLIDGSGSEPVPWEIAVKDGKIAAMGDLRAVSADQELDASGQVVAPGFIDIHTHFDPQLCWDGFASPSLEHGVTTVVTGNCSLSLAPIRGRSGADKMVSMFSVIEDIKKLTFDQAVPFSWETFPEYLDHIRPNLGINVGAMIGHSAVRLYVMGAANWERVATDEEIAAMCVIIEEAMAAGALGISSSHLDMDERGRPVPSRYADLKERIALAKAMAKSGRGVWQIAPFFPDPRREIQNIEELGEISLAARVVGSVQPVMSSPSAPLAEPIIDVLEALQKRGARVFGQVMPRCFDLNMRLSETSLMLLTMPRWKAIMDLPASERLAQFGDPAQRETLVNEVNHAKGMASTLRYVVVGEVHCEANAAYRGRTLREIAKTEGKALGEVILDIALADNLETEFQLKNVINANKAAVAKLIDHPLCHFGASDAGAHISQFCGSGDTTHLLEYYVRETGHLSLARAVHRMTGEVARDWGFNDRGLLKVDLAADIVIFDPATVGVSAEQFVHDYPGEARRYVRKSRGYSTVLVNGQIALKDGAYTGVRAGRVV